MSGPWEKYAAPAAEPAVTTPDAFREQYGPAAERAARELGVSPSAVLGQWGLETGWGKSIVPGTNNLGNIKDVRGGGVRARDNVTGSNDAYRAYDSPDAFAADYVSLIKRKYPGAVGAGDDAQKFAAALKAGGYAEDPRYVDKLVAASRTAAPRSLVSRGAEAVLSAVSGSAQAADAPAGPWAKYARAESSPAAGAEMPKPNAMARMGRGFMDVSQGLKQLWLMGTGKPGEADAYTKQVNDEIALYDKGRGKGAGTDWMRVAGNVAATAPAILIPGATAPTLGARMAAGAAAGGLASGAMVSDAASVGAKAGQVVMGAVTGAAVPVAITGAVKGASGVVNAAAEALRRTIQSATGAASPAQITVTLQQTLASAGIDYNALSASAKAALYQDVKATLKAGAPVAADQIERKASMLAVGVKPTAAQVTRDPKRWAFERNTADINGAGDRLKARFLDQNRALLDSADQARKAVGGANPPPDAYEAAAGAIKGLGAADASRKAAVDAAYEGARNTAGRYAQIDHLAFVKQANDALDAGMLGTYLPTQVRNLLNDVSTGKLPLNDTTAVQLDSVLSAAQRGAQPAEQKAIGIVRTALSDAPSSDVLGDGARAAFDQARGLAKNRFAAIEGNPALKAALDGVEPDQFFGKFVLRGNAADLQKIGKELLATDPQAWNGLRGQTVQWLIDKATGGKGAEGAFSGAALRKAMDSLGPQRMSALFLPSELGQLQTLAKAASASTEAPAFTRAGIGSNTAEKLANMGNKLANLPYLRELVINPVRHTAQDIKIGQALTGAAPAASAAPLLSQQAQRAAAQRAGVASIPLSILINGAASR